MTNQSQTSDQIATVLFLNDREQIKSVINSIRSLLKLEYLLPFILILFFVVRYLLQSIGCLTSHILMQLLQLFSLSLLVEDYLELEVGKDVVAELVPFHGGIVSWRGEQWVQPNPQTILNHSWNYPRKQGTRYLQAWVEVDFNQPRFEVVINHEIHPKHLEVVQLPLDIQFVEIGLDSISCHLFHLRKDILLKTVLFPHEVHVQVPLEFTVRQLIPRLVPTIVLPIFLNRIICKVYISVAEVFYIELV